MDKDFLKFIQKNFDKKAKFTVSRDVVLKGKRVVQFCYPIMEEAKYKRVLSLVEEWVRDRECFYYFSIDEEGGVHEIEFYNPANENILDVFIWETAKRLKEFSIKDMTEEEIKHFILGNKIIYIVLDDYYKFYCCFDSMKGVKKFQRSDPEHEYMVRKYVFPPK